MAEVPDDEAAILKRLPGYSLLGALLSAPLLRLTDVTRAISPVLDAEPSQPMATRQSAVTCSSRRLRTLSAMTPSSSAAEISTSIEAEWSALAGGSTTRAARRRTTEG